jgi:integrase/recombinase XerD
MCPLKHGPFHTSYLTEAVAMDSSELERFEPLYEEMIQAMKLHGLRSKTIESYCCSIRRVAHFFNRCPDDLN